MDAQDRLELVERVREKAGVGYADAKTALDACGDDLLDALVWLEEQGRSATRTARSSTGAPADGVSSEMRAAQTAYARSSETGAQMVAGGFSRLRAWVRRTWRRGMETRVVSRRGGAVSLPLLPTVAGIVSWLMLSLQTIYAYNWLWRDITLIIMVVPVICFFYLVFACRLERPANSGAAAPSPEGEPRHD